MERTSFGHHANGTGCLSAWRLVGCWFVMALVLILCNNVGKDYKWVVSVRGAQWNVPPPFTTLTARVVSVRGGWLVACLSMTLVLILWGDVILTALVSENKENLGNVVYVLGNANKMLSFVY